MVLLPLMQFIFDTDWPTGEAAVFMTPTRVWGPLSAGLAFSLLTGEWLVALVGLAVTLGFVWANPRFYEQITWNKGGEK